ncbi:MAG: hypothetical protein H6969_07805 [Gammaproteobacteria bacterium]|nr:hypothetical protein [Gammaproteobacteria bacterium]
MLHYERSGRCNPFVDEVESYTTFIWQHMYKEETILLPLAEDALTQEDWERMERAFKENDNPLLGLKPKEQSELLFQKILNLAPAPIGLGPPVS